MVLNKSSLQILALAAAVCLMAGCDESNSGNGNTNNNDNTVECDDNNSSMRCVDNNVVKCENSKWVVKIPCSNVQKCDPTSLTCKDNIIHVCDEGATQCDKAGNVWIPKKCEQNAWREREACKEGQNCDGSEGKCVDPTCTTGVTCDGDNLVVCSDAGKEEITKCATKGMVCSESAKDCVEPSKDNNCTIEKTSIKVNDGQTVCYDNMRYSCTKGVISSDSCDEDEVCRDGENSCSKRRDCTVGSTVIKHNEFGCNADKDVVKCNDGSLKVDKDCENNQVCQKEGENYICKTPQADSCTFNGETVDNGKSVCDGTVIKTCASGTLNTGKDCATDADKSVCSAGVCVAKSCNDGAVPSGSQFCNDEKNKIMLCTNGQTSEVKTCDSGQVCQPGATPECKAEATVKKYTTIKSIHDDYEAITTANPKGCNNDGYSVMQRADVTITGVVTGVKSNGFFIQDPNVSSGEYAGIMVHCLRTADNTNCTLDSTFGSSNVKLGDNVTVTASYVGYNYCQLWVRGEKKNASSITVTKLNDKKNIQPKVVTIPQIIEGAHNAYNGTMVKVTDVMVGECDANGSKYCKVRDSSEKDVYVTNYIDNYVSKLKNEKGKYLDVTGIGYYDHDLKASSLGAKSYKTNDCSGTQTKCEDNILYTCNSGKWPATGTACTADKIPANSRVACSSDGATCSFRCLYGDILENNTCPEQSSGASCTDYYSATIKHNNRGCTTKSKYAVCNNGSWGTATECPDPGIENAVPLCKPDGACGFECKPGFTPNGNKCQKSVFDSCTDFSGKAVSHGKYGCTADSKHAICNDGEWKNEETCPNPGFEHASAVCNEYDGSCGIKCEGDLIPNATNTACVEDKLSCQVASGVPDANHGDTVCYDTFSLATCNNGRWENDQHCSNGCELGATSCNSSSGVTCQVASGVPDAHEGDVVCYDTMSLATCTAEGWRNDQPCSNGCELGATQCNASSGATCQIGSGYPDAHEGDVVCYDTMSLATCTAEGWRNDNPCPNGCELGAKKCNDAPEVTCKISGHPDAHNGDVACYNYNALGTCNNGNWGNPQSCEYGCNLGANACNGAPVTWCQFKHLASDGSEAYVRFKPSADSTNSAYAVVYCADRSLSSTYPIDMWDDDRSGYAAYCGDCGDNIEWKFTGLDKDAGTTDCVAVVYNITISGDIVGTGVVCPKDDINESIFNPASRIFNQEKMATSGDILSYSGTGAAPLTAVPLAEWNFDNESVNVTGGSLMSSASFALANSTATLSYINHGDHTNKAVSARNWPNSVNLASGAHYLVSMSTRGYKNIKISFDSRVSTAENASIQVAYKTSSSASFTSTSIQETYIDDSFKTLSPAQLPTAVDNAETLYIGIFPATKANANTVSLDNLVISGEPL